MMQGMVIDMEEARLQTLAQVKAFPEGTEVVAVPKAERHRFIGRVLKGLAMPRMGEQTRACCCVIKTPREKLESLPNASQHLKSNATFDQLDVLAARMSDNDAALALDNARRKLFQAISAAIKKQA